ncbi:MAG: hypothetical protein ACLUPZ_17605, partial [Lachnospiraceae bacterium]
KCNFEITFGCFSNELFYHRNPSFEVVESSFLLYPAEKVIATIETKSSGKTKIFMRRGRCCAKKLKDCVG